MSDTFLLSCNAEELRLLVRLGESARALLAEQAAREDAAAAPPGVSGMSPERSALRSRVEELLCGFAPPELAGVTVLSRRVLTASDSPTGLIVRFGIDGPGEEPALVFDVMDDGRGGLVLQLRPARPG